MQPGNEDLPQDLISAHGAALEPGQDSWLEVVL